MYNFHYYNTDQTSTIAQTETVSPTVVGGAPSDSVSDGNQASKWLLNV